MMPDETNTQPEQNQTEESTVQQSPRPDDSGAVEAQAATHAAEDSPPGQKIQIGSRRKNTEGGKPRGAKPHVGGKAPAIPAAVSNKGPVPVPSVRDNLPQDLEDEIAAALEGESIDDLMEQSTPAAAAQVETDDRRRATVIRIDAKHLFVSLSSASEGVISLQVFTEIPEVGSEIDVIVTGFNEDDQIYEVTVPGAAVSVADWSDLQEGAVIDVTITGSNVGGLECQVNSIRGFIPASQISTYRVENFEEYVGKKLQCVVTEASAERRNLVLSHRSIMEREAAEQREQKLGSLEVGSVHEGIVRSVKDFGAFVDIGGIDGLIHISQMSWDRVKHPSELVKEGDKVKVRLEKINPETGKLGLSLRAMQTHPWEGINERFRVGEVVSGAVSRIADFGAFVRLAPGIEGLVHISELAHRRVNLVSTEVSEGQDVSVKVLSVDVQNQRIALSIKQTTAAPAKESKRGDAEELPPRELAVKRSNAPLKGGRDRSSGGEQFGLKW
jgi:small subunit ribosomal protein S1